MDPSLAGARRGDPGRSHGGRRSLSRRMRKVRSLHPLFLSLARRHCIAQQSSPTRQCTQLTSSARRGLVNVERPAAQEGPCAPHLAARPPVGHLAALVLGASLLSLKACSAIADACSIFGSLQDTPLSTLFPQLYLARATSHHLAFPPPPSAPLKTDPTHGGKTTAPSAPRAVDDPGLASAWHVVAAGLWDAMGASLPPSRLGACASSSAFSRLNSDAALDAPLHRHRPSRTPTRLARARARRPARALVGRAPVRPRAAGGAPRRRGEGGGGEEAAARRGRGEGGTPRDGREGGLAVERVARAGRGRSCEEVGEMCRRRGRRRGTFSSRSSSRRRRRRPQLTLAFLPPLPLCLARSHPTPA